MLKSLNNPNRPLTLGILGGGQLAKMLANDAYRMGINVSIIEKEENTPAGDMTKLDFAKGWLDTDELNRFIESCDIVTLENEFIDPNILDLVNKKRTVYPSPETMRKVQDKYIQKMTFADAGLPVPTFNEINSREEAMNFGNEHGFPFVIKTRKYGYDGYGNATVRNKMDIEEAWNKFNSGRSDRPLMAEKFVTFTKELAVMVARNKSGETVVYPCVETIQKNHICHDVIAEAEIPKDNRKKAQEIALAAVRSVDGVGVFGVEMFLTNDGNILINEIAPRPHNSGHYTIEACYTSQYENVIRAICDLPLGSADMICGGAAMVNLLGVRDGIGVPNNVVELLKHKNVWLHLYNKKMSRKGRKMGHVTALGNSPTEAIATARAAANAIEW